MPYASGAALQPSRDLQLTPPAKRTALSAAYAPSSASASLETMAHGAGDLLRMMSGNRWGRCNMVTRSKLLKQHDQTSSVQELGDDALTTVPSRTKAEKSTAMIVTLPSVPSKVPKAVEQPAAGQKRPVLLLHAHAAGPSAETPSPVPSVTPQPAAAAYKAKLISASSAEAPAPMRQSAAGPRIVRQAGLVRSASSGQLVDTAEVVRLSKPLSGSVQKRVRFAPGHLNVTISPKSAPDGHPATEGCVCVPVRHVPSSYAKDLTRGNVLMLEQMLGEDCAASISRLKRRVGLLPPIRAPRPYVNCRHVTSSSNSKVAVACGQTLRGHLKPVLAAVRDSLTAGSKDQSGGL
jgi:hypothetical protein